jgi:hypothetical protein
MFLVNIIGNCHAFLLSTHCHVAGTVSKIINRNRFGEGNDTNQGRRVFFILLTASATPTGD